MRLLGYKFESSDCNYQWPDREYQYHEKRVRNFEKGVRAEMDVTPLKPITDRQLGINSIFGYTDTFGPFIYSHVA